MKIKGYIVVLIASAFLLSSPLQAQQNKKIDSKVVEVTRTYQGLIINDNRIEIPLKLSDSTTMFTPSFNYVVAPNYLPVFSIKTAIKPVIIKETIENPIKNFGYIRVGLGYPLSPLGDVYLHNRFTDNSFINLYYNHRSFWGNVPLVTSQPAGAAMTIPTSIIGDNAQNDLGLSVEHRLGNVYINAGVEYKRRYLLFHGHDAAYLSYLSNSFPSYIDRLNDDPGYFRNALKQTYDFVNARLGVASKDLREDFSYRADLTFDYAHDQAIQNISPLTAKPVKEFVGGVNGQVAKTFDLTHTASLSFDAMFYNKGNVSRLSDYKFTITPAYMYRQDGINISVGIDLEGVYSSRETANNKRDSGDFKMHVYPNISFTGIMTEYLTVYAGMGGRTELNTYQKIALENPYILPGLAVNATSTPFDVTVGARGKMFDLLGYNVFGSYDFIDSMYFYVNSKQSIYSPDLQSPPPTGGYLQHNFDVLYSKVNQFTIGTDIDYTNAGFKAMFRGRYNFYVFNNAKFAKAYQKPAVELGLDLSYKYDAFTFQLGATMRGKTPILYQSPTIAEEVRYIDAYFDLGAQVEYRINKRLTAFVYGQNLFNSKYQNYYLYYAQGILGGAGITLVL